MGSSWTDNPSRSLDCYIPNLLRFSLVGQLLSTLPVLSIPFWLVRGYLFDIHNLLGSKIVVLA